MHTGEWIRGYQVSPLRSLPLLAPLSIRMGVFQGRKNAVRNSFNCPNSASVLSPLSHLTHTQPHAHTNCQYIHIAVILSAQYSITILHSTLYLWMLFLASLHSQLKTILTKTILLNIFPWSHPSQVRLIYATISTQQMTSVCFHLVAPVWRSLLFIQISDLFLFFFSPIFSNKANY